MSKFECKRCNQTTEPILKMGGLICRNCRVILHYPGTVEYSKVYKETNEKYQKEQIEENKDLLKKLGDK